MYFALESGKGSMTFEYKLSSESLPSLSQWCICLLQCPFAGLTATHIQEACKSWNHLDPSSPRTPKISAEIPRSLNIFPEAIGRWVQWEVKDFAEVKAIQVPDSWTGCDFNHHGFFTCAELPGCFCLGSGQIGTVRHQGWTLPWGSDNEILAMVCKSDQNPSAQNDLCKSKILFLLVRLFRFPLLQLHLQHEWRHAAKTKLDACTV